MNKSEALEFLELKVTATDSEIRSRLEEKLSYFQQLSVAAPSDFLQKLHVKNVEKVQAIRQLFFPDSTAAKAASQPSSHRQSTNQSEATGEPVGWLIRHTEHTSTRPFAIYAGENHFGRESFSGKRSHVLENDPYISRQHAIVEVADGYEPIITIKDVGELTGKYSKNGIYINGADQRISGSVKLKEGDTLQIGVTKLVVRFNKQAPVHKIVEEISKTEYIKTVVIDIF